MGLAVFYQYVKDAVLNQQHFAVQVSIFTAELFAHYLLIRCLYRQTSLTDEVQRYRTYLTDAPQLFITDVLLYMWSSIQICYSKEPVETQKLITERTEPNTPERELVELLQQSAVEHLTAYRHLEAQQFRSFATIVTTDYEALYAYKRGDYQRCLQISTQNVRPFWASCIRASEVLTDPMFIQLLDDDIVSLIALTLIVNPECREVNTGYTFISQLTLSMYLMTQCQLKLHHSVTSLAQTLDYIEIAQKKHPVCRTLDQLTLKLTARKVMTNITVMIGD